MMMTVVDNNDINDDDDVDKIILKEIESDCASFH